MSPQCSDLLDPQARESRLQESYLHLRKCQMVFPPFLENIIHYKLKWSKPIKKGKKHVLFDFQSKSSIQIILFTVSTAKIARNITYPSVMCATCEAPVGRICSSRSLSWKISGFHGDFMVIAWDIRNTWPCTI